jgi:hypothetical protein
MTSVSVLVTLIALAVAMVAVTAFLIRWAARSRTQLRSTLVLFLLLMMSAMFLGAVVYFLTPGAGALVEGFWVASVAMSAAVLLFFVEFARETRAAAVQGAGYVPSPVRHAHRFVGYLTGTVLLNELLMGWTFQRAAGGPIWIGGGSVPGLLTGVLISPWFVFPMALEMGLTLALMGEDFPRPMRTLLAVQPIVMVASPPSLSGVVWVVASAVLASVAMAGALAYVLRRLYRGDPFGPATLGYTLRLFGTFGLMAGGLAWWAWDGGAELFALGVALQMVVYLDAIFTPRRFADEGRGGGETAVVDVPSPGASSA